jgi:hypothetical protein
MKLDPKDIPRATGGGPPGWYHFRVLCRQEEFIMTYDYDEWIWAQSAEEALNKVREMFICQLRRETDLYTTGPRGAKHHLKIPMAELKQAREPKPVQLELPL